jgi:hypothetical protein
MRKLLLFFILTSLFLSCKQTSKPINESILKDSVEIKISNSNNLKIAEILIDKHVDTSLIYKINENSVFFAQLTTNESDSLENADPDAYEIFSENANNNATNALELLDKLKIKNFWSDKKYVSFRSMKENYLIDTRLKNIIGEYCILFRKDLMPELLRIDLLNEETLSTYFKK